jgi:uncharacterized membrane protein YecN with MAPEG domain
MTASITGLYAGLSGALLVALAFAVSMQRMRHQVPIGDGGVPAVERAVRVHGNAVEHVPMAMLLLFLVEVNGAPGAVVHGAGAAFVLARLAHATGLASSGGRTPGRFYGTLVSWLVMIGLALGLVVQYLATLLA